MFGLIPRTVWSRSVPTDDKGRITVQHNCLALTRPGTDKVVLIETGTGVKLDPASRPTLKRAGYLTRDPRKKERKKYGQKGARARFQFSKR